MKISNKTIEYFRWIITWDLWKSTYASWWQLVKFFNLFWYNETYWQWFPSRRFYAEQKLIDLNNNWKIKNVIEYYYNPINFINEEDKLSNLIIELNKYLLYDGLILIIKDNKVTLIDRKNDSFIHTEANFIDWNITIKLQKNIFSHVQSLLKSWHHFNAVEESYKIVREKLKNITWEEQAHKWFKEENYEMIFWHKPKNDVEKDFFEWVKFLHMAIQNLRNEKAHTPAKELDKNLAIHYIVLASLAYDLINRNIKEIDKKQKSNQEIIDEYFEEKKWEQQFEEMRDREF